jgi:hypothetical protein
MFKPQTSMRPTKITMLGTYKAVTYMSMICLSIIFLFLMIIE